jgi:hypothetical protein
MELKAFMWLAGVSFTGFLFILGWVIKLQKELHVMEVAMEKRVPYEWLEKNLIQKFDNINIKVGHLQAYIESELGSNQTPGNIRRVVKDIRDEMKIFNAAIIGDTNKPGLIHEVHGLKKEFEDYIKKNGRDKT